MKLSNRHKLEEAAQLSRCQGEFDHELLDGCHRHHPRLG